MLPSERAIASRRSAQLRTEAARYGARLRARLGTGDPFAIARALGVEVSRAPRSRADAEAGIRAEYLPDPPTILLYDAADEALAVAHELFHHLECGGLPPLSGVQATTPRAPRRRDSDSAARAFALALVGEGAPDGD